MDKHFLDDVGNFMDDLESRDQFIIDNMNGNATLTVFPDIHGKGGPDHEMFLKISERIRILGIKDLQEDNLWKIIFEKKGSPIIIGKWVEGKKENSVIHITVSEDKMKAYMTISPPHSGGLSPSESDIHDALNQNGVFFGIDHNQIQTWLKNPEYNTNLVVAQGKHPRPGSNGEIRILFNSDTQKQRIDEKKSVDHREIGIIRSVKTGYRLAVRIEAEPGQVGQKINGEIIPAESGKNAEFKIGPNVIIKGNDAVATITGRPVLEKNGIIRVDEMITLDKVDYSTGNIDFPGSIIVEDRMADGFRLTTKGSIIIKKSVGKVFLKADGEIIIEGGFLGKDEGRIESEKDVSVRFVERGRILARGSIYVRDAAMHSDLIAGDSIFLGPGRGDLIGGETIAGNNIHVNKLGAVVETRTQAIVGIQYDVIQMVNSLKNDMSEQEEILKKIENTEKQLDEKKRKSKEPFNDEEMNLIEKLKSVKNKYLTLLSSLKKQYEKTLESFRTHPGAYMFIQKEMHHGVEINFGQNRVYKSPLKPVSGKIYIYLDDDNNIISASHEPRIKETEEPEKEKSNAPEKK